jgi:hypothetical protein
MDFCPPCVSVFVARLAKWLLGWPTSALVIVEGARQDGKVVFRSN